MLFKSSLNIRKIVVYNGFFCLLIACCPKFSAVFGESLLSDIQLSDVCRRLRNSAWPSPPVIVVDSLAAVLHLPGVASARHLCRMNSV